MPHDVIMPQLGMAQDTGIITAWRKKVGDPIAAADILMEVETDKTTVEVEAGRDGFVVHICAGENTPVPVGSVVAVIADSPDVIVEKKARPVSKPTEPAEPASPAAAPAQPAAPESAKTRTAVTRVLASPKARVAAKERGIDLAALAAGGGKQPVHYADLDRHEALLNSADARVGAAFSPAASPYVRLLARRHGVDLAAVAARTGNDQVYESDIMKALSGAPQQAPETDALVYWQVDHAAFGPVETEPLTNRDLAAADNLQAAARVIPAVVHFDRAEMDACENFRKSLLGEAESRGVRLTALAFHVKALSRCLQKFPRFNTSLSPDGKSLIIKKYIHIGLAVDTPSGLVVPVVRDADKKDIWDVAANIADLAERARDRALRPADTGGGSMTISNLGGVGGENFTPIINPPEIAIIGVSRTSIKPVWDGEQFQPVSICPLALTYDHRVVNGADAARFMRCYAALLSEPRGLQA